jgi:phospholipid/cholesterol/gamma-HCH transport system permease protein
MPIKLIENTLKSFLFEVQAFFSLTGQAFRCMVHPPYYYRDFATQLDKMGVGSLFIIILTGLFTGMVMALQALAQLKPFAATSYVGGMVAVTMVKELGPVLSALMVTGRVGSAITAEIGTMVVTEQLDAMRVEGTDIVKRLITSRLKAILIAMPLLAVVTDTVSLIGGYIMSAGYGINPTMYWQSLSQFMVFQDLIEGVVKPVFFGILIVMIGCYVGLNTRGGAAGVGESAKKAVVLTSVLILVSDFFLAKIFIAFRG